MKATFAEWRGIEEKKERKKRKTETSEYLHKH